MTAYEPLLLTLLQLVLLYLINYTTFVDLHITTTQGILVLIAAVAQRAPVYLNVWRRCRGHFKGANPPKDQLIELISGEVARLSITFAGLSYITGWYKRQSVYMLVTYTSLVLSTILSALMLVKISMKEVHN